MAPRTSSVEAGWEPPALCESFELLHPIAASRTAAATMANRCLRGTVMAAQDRGGGGRGARLPHVNPRLFLDRGADRAAPLRPGAVVVPDVGVAEQLVENEPRV